MKILYFDIDGTILQSDREEVKGKLGGGRLEKAIRAARFEKLICVGQYAAVVRIAGDDYDALGVLFRICRGAFSDLPWFRSVTDLIPYPEERTRSIDLTSDWWYMDDLAETYFGHANQLDVYETHRGGRVLVPDPRGNGSDVLEWLEGSTRE